MSNYDRVLILDSNSKMRSAIEKVVRENTDMLTGYREMDYKHKLILMSGKDFCQNPAKARRLAKNHLRENGRFVVVSTTEFYLQQALMCKFVDKAVYKHIFAEREVFTPTEGYISSLDEFLEYINN